MESTTMAANTNQLPSVDQWTQWMHDAPPAQATSLLQYALDLAKNVQEQRWGTLIGIAERVLRERGIAPG